MEWEVCGTIFRVRPGKMSADRRKHGGVGVTNSMNRKQEVFIQEYLIDMNGAAAARRAGYSHKHAKATACRILGSPEVQRAVQAALTKRKEENEVSGARVRRELADIAFQKADGAAVGHKIRCLELLAKMLGLFEGNRDVEPVTVVEDL